MTQPLPYGSQFRINQFGYNIADFTYAAAAGAANYPQWTTGASQIDAIQFGRQTTNPVRILGFSVSAFIWRQVSSTAGELSYGRYSKILAGLTPQNPSNLAPFTFTPSSLPANTLNLATLWDPDSDELPPSAPETFVGNQLQSPVTPLNVQCSFTLPQPLNLTSPSAVNIGIWMLPSLLSYAPSITVMNGGIVLKNASYTVISEVLPGGQGPIS